MANLLKTFMNSIKHWYIPLIIGVLFIIFGIYIFTVPQETYMTLAIMFSISFIVSGLFDSFFAVQNRETLNGWGWYLVSGLLSLVIGLYLLNYLTISMAVLPFFVGFTLLFRSFQLLGFAFELRDLKVLNWGNVAITSVLGIALSFMLLASPLFVGVSLVVLTALTFIFVGVSSILLSLNLKKIKNYPEKISDELKSKIETLQAELAKEAKKD